LTNKHSEQQIVTDFARQMLYDAHLLPGALLRRYREMQLDAEDALLLARIIAPLYQSGSAPLSVVMQEFSVEQDQAEQILQPFMEKGFVEYDKKQGVVTCEGLNRKLFLLWAGDRHPAHAAAPLPAGKRERRDSAGKEQIRQISHLYHRFEQELGRALKYTESDRLRTWLNEDAYSAELIEEALKRAVLQDKCTFAYIDSILRAWQKKGYRTLEEVLSQDQRVAAAQPAVPRTVKGKLEREQQRQKETNEYDDIYKQMLKA